MRYFYRSILFGIIIAVIAFVLRENDLVLWDLNLVSVSGLVAGIFFILAMMFRSALIDYKEADKNICYIRGKLCGMNDININAALNPQGKKYDPTELGEYFILTLKTIKKYLSGTLSFSRLQDSMNMIVYKSLALDKATTPAKMSRFFQFQDALRGYMSYLEYGKWLHFPQVAYIFLYFFIFLLVVLQIFARVENVPLGLLFVFSLSSVLLFFAEFVRDMDRPFDKKNALFFVDLKPLDLGMKNIEHALEYYQKHKKAPRRRKRSKK